MKLINKTPNADIVVELTISVDELYKVSRALYDGDNQLNPDGDNGTPPFYLVLRNLCDKITKCGGL